MTPEQCRELAEFHGEMQDWCERRANESEGFTAAAYNALSRQHLEAYRNWCRREKAGE